MGAFVLLTSCSNGSTEKQNSADLEIRENSEEINNVKESLKFEAEITNKLIAGKQFDAMTRVDSVSFDGECFVYTYEINEDYATIEQLQKFQRKTMEENLKNNWENNPQLAGIKEKLIRINGKVVYNYVGSSSKDVIKIVIEL